MATSAQISTFSSREFNQDTGKAKRAAKQGPVIITDRGEPSHVLLTYLEYEELRSHSAAEASRKPFVSLAEALSHPESAHIDFEIPKLDYRSREVDVT